MFSLWRAELYPAPKLCVISMYINVQLTTFYVKLCHKFYYKPVLQREDEIWMRNCLEGGGKSNGWCYCIWSLLCVVLLFGSLGFMVKSTSSLTYQIFNISQWEDPIFYSPMCFLPWVSHLMGVVGCMTLFKGVWAEERGGEAWVEGER